MRPIVRLALGNLRRAWLRSALSAVAVATGVSTLVAADLISQSVTEEIARTNEALAITAFMSEQLNIGLTVVGLVVAAGAGFVVFNAFSMAVAQRRADLGRLRATGMTRRQVVAMVMLEAGLIGAGGAAVGAAAGVGLSEALIALVKATSEMFNRFGHGQISPARLLWAAGLGIAVALLAALIPALRAARVAPLAALRPSLPAGLTRASHRRALACVLLMVALWAYLALDPPGRWILPPWSTILSLVFGGLWLACLAICAPALVDFAGGTLRRPLQGVLGAPGLLAADNLRRGRGRVTFALLTLAVGVGMIVGVTGYMSYWFEELFFRTADHSLRQNPGFGFFPLDIQLGLQAYAGITDFTMPDGLRERVEQVVVERATVVETYFVLAPELSFLGERYFSYVLDPRSMRQAGELFFSFTYGDWEHAMDIVGRGCAVFITMAVAQKNDAWLDDVIALDTPGGPLECTVAGVGPTFVGASILSDAALSAYGLSAPVNLTVFPRSSAERESLQPQLEALAEEYGVWLMDLSRLTELQRQGMKSIQTVMDGMLLLAILSAALGVVNTSIIGLIERRQEFTVLRAVGATPGQMRAVVLTEGLLVGVLGALMGILAGAGIVLLYVVITAGTPFGFPDFPAWPAALASVRPALGRGLLAAVATPLLAALAAWLPARSALGSPALEAVIGAAQAW